MSQPRTKVIIIRETVKESIISDGISFLSLITLMLIGRFVGSEALVWIGAISMLVAGFSRLSGNGVTIAEARKQLDELEREYHP